VAVALKVLSSHALMEIINALAPAFERATGHGFAAGYDPSSVLKRRIESGEDFDGAIMTRTALDALTVRGVIVPGGITDLGRSGIGLSVPKGARNRRLRPTTTSKTLCFPHAPSCGPRTAQAAPIS
jgi:molybdate transport system substrate-binding protein